MFIVHSLHPFKDTLISPQRKLEFRLQFYYFVLFWKYIAVSNTISVPITALQNLIYF